MANEFLQKIAGTQLRYFLTGSFSPADAGTDWTIGTPTDVALTLNAIADGAGRQSLFIDAGATRSASYELLGCVDFTGETPTAGEVVEYYIATKVHSTQATGNVAGSVHDGMMGCRIAAGE